MAAAARVLWLHSHFQLPTGGTSYIYEVVRRLAEHMPVDVLVESASPLWRERYSATRAQLHEVGGPTSTSLGYWAAFPAFLARDLRAVRTCAAAADVVVSSFFPMPWLAGQVARPGHQRHVSLCFEPFPFFHDPEVIGMYPAPKRALLRGLRRAYGHLDAAGITSADALITLNPTTRRHLERVYGRTDAVCAYAGVDTETFRPYPSEELDDLRARFGAGPLVVHSTDYSPIKRTDLALQAFAVARRRVPEARLVITSTRQDRAAEEALARWCRERGLGDAVDFAGFLPFADLPRLYSLAAAVLQTGTSTASGATTMSLPVKEAMACGTPVVRSGVTDEDVEDGVSGYLVDPLDSAATGGRLALLLADPHRAARMGRAGRERIVRQYHWSRVAQVVREAIEA